MLSSFLRRRCAVGAVSSLPVASSAASLLVAPVGSICSSYYYPTSVVLSNNNNNNNTTVLRFYQHSGRSRRGLYDGKDIRSGNNVPFSMKKTRRKWKPNVFIKKLYSETFDAMIPFHVTAAALRSIDKAGGLDPYILKQNDFFPEGEGFRMKKRILQRRKNIAYFARKGLQHVSISATTAREQGSQEDDDSSNSSSSSAQTS